MGDAQHAGVDRDRAAPGLVVGGEDERALVVLAERTIVDAEGGVQRQRGIRRDFDDIVGSGVTEEVEGTGRRDAQRARDGAAERAQARGGRGAEEVDDIGRVAEGGVVVDGEDARRKRDPADEIVVGVVQDERAHAGLRPDAAVDRARDLAAQGQALDDIGTGRDADVDRREILVEGRRARELESVAVGRRDGERAAGITKGKRPELQGLIGAGQEGQRTGRADAEAIDVDGSAGIDRDVTAEGKRAEGAGAVAIIVERQRATVEDDIIAVQRPRRAVAARQSAAIDLQGTRVDVDLAGERVDRGAGRAADDQRRRAGLRERGRRGVVGDDRGDRQRIRRCLIRGKDEVAAGRACDRATGENDVIGRDGRADQHATRGDRVNAGEIEGKGARNIEAE